jgi:hypothetical protein
LVPTQLTQWRDPNNLQVQHPTCCDALQNERDELQQVKEQLQKSKELEKSRSRFVADMSVRLPERFALTLSAVRA